MECSLGLEHILVRKAHTSSILNILWEIAEAEENVKQAGRSDSLVSVGISCKHGVTSLLSLNLLKFLLGHVGVNGMPILCGTEKITSVSIQITSELDFCMVSISFY